MARYGPGERQNALVERVVDGDTAVMKVGGESVYVRYIGVDTPEMNWDRISDSEDCARDATDFNADQVEGRRVQLEFDRELYDRYDRLLAYVRVDGRLVNADLLRDGLATTLTIRPNDRYADRFSALEREARANSRGLWRGCR